MISRLFFKLIIVEERDILDSILKILIFKITIITYIIELLDIDFL